jgi:hypothetical protein
MITNSLLKKNTNKRYKLFLNKNKRKIFNFTKNSFSVLLQKIKPHKHDLKFNLDDEDMP